MLAPSAIVPTAGVLGSPGERRAKVITSICLQIRHFPWTPSRRITILSEFVLTECSESGLHQHPLGTQRICRYIELTNTLH